MVEFFEIKDTRGDERFINLHAISCIIQCSDESDVFVLTMQGGSQFSISREEKDRIVSRINGQQ